MIASEPVAAVNDEIDLIAICRMLWGYKYLIVLSVGVCVLVAIFLALTATSIYRGEVAITQVRDGGMGAASSIVNQLGGLASLAGVNLGSGGDVGREAQAVLSSRRLVEEFINRNDLLQEILAKAKEPRNLWFAVERFRHDVLSIREDKRAGVIRVTVDWTDPVTAAKWANGFVALTNEVIRTRDLDNSNRNIAYLNEQIARTNVVELQRVMYGLIENETKTAMLASARLEYAFTVVDPAVPPQVRTSPKRTVMVLVGAALGFFFGVVGAFTHSIWSRRKTERLGARI